MLFFLMALGAIVSGIIASSKNRSAIVWAVVGLFVPVLSVIILLCLAPIPIALPSEPALPGNRAA